MSIFIRAVWNWVVSDCKLCIMNTRVDRSLPLIRVRGHTKTQTPLSSRAGQSGQSSEFINRRAEAGCSAGSSEPGTFLPMWLCCGRPGLTRAWTTEQTRRVVLDRPCSLPVPLPSDWAWGPAPLSLCPPDWKSNSRGFYPSVSVASTAESRACLPRNKHPHRCWSPKNDMKSHCRQVRKVLKWVSLN